jgi:hypothetical protein
MNRDYPTTELQQQRASRYLRIRRRHRLFDTWLCIYDAQHPDSVFDPTGGRWVTYCENHETLCNHQSFYLAVHFAQSTKLCEYCASS